MTTHSALQKKRLAKARAVLRERAVKNESSENYAVLTAALLARDEKSVITRPGARVYSHEAAKEAEKLQGNPKVAVTFRMERAEFSRLRKGADKLGLKPRDILHRAIKSCLDANGVR